jgi:hypothetical protein
LVKRWWGQRTGDGDRDPERSREIGEKAASLSVVGRTSLKRSSVCAFGVGEREEISPFPCKALEIRSIKQTLVCGSIRGGTKPASLRRSILIGAILELDIRWESDVTVLWPMGSRHCCTAVERCSAYSLIDVPKRLL